MNKGETMEKIDWENCKTKWGDDGKGRLGQYCGSRYGEIVKVHEDGKMDILIKGYPDEIITTDKFDVNYWEEDRRESKIRRMKERAEVGMWVEVVEFRIVFYIYIWEKRYSYPYPDKCIIKHKFKCGKPHYSAREVEHRIFDVATKDYMDFKRFGRF